MTTYTTVLFNMKLYNPGLINGNLWQSLCMTTLVDTKPQFKKANLKIVTLANRILHMLKQHEGIRGLEVNSECDLITSLVTCKTYQL